MTVIIRRERSGDQKAITAVIEAAFRRHPHSDQTEHLLINDLRDAGALSLSLVADRDGTVVGHVGFSPVRLSDASQDWYGLAPLSVAPAHQRRGIGTRLVNAGLAALGRIKAAGCVVFGDPAYYRRFGFKSTPAWRFAGAPAGYFQVLCFDEEPDEAEFFYHSEFYRERGGPKGVSDP